MSEKRSESWCFFVCLFFATLPTVLLLFTFNSHRKKDLWLAASRGDLLTCQAILALSRGEKYKVNFKEPLSGTTALHVACTFGHSHIVQALLADKRVKMKKDCCKMTPLQTACLFSKPECVKMFLETKPRPKGNYTTAAFRVACRSGSGVCADFG